MENKTCKMCSTIKPLSHFRNKIDNPKFHYATCRKCLRRKREMDRKTAKHWKWPYAKGINTMLKDPKYIKHKNDLFKNHNGWWWGDGFWNGKTEIIADRTRRSKIKHGKI